MRTLYATDLDGTLLNKQDSISSKSLHIINSLIDEGMCFTYATARSLSSASVVAKGLRTEIPVIIYNGAFIMKAGSGEILYACDFEEEEKEYLIDAFKRYNISPLVYSFIEKVEKVSWINDDLNEGKKRYLGLRKGDRRLNPLKVGENLFAGNPFYYTCIGEKEELAPLYEELKTRGFNCIFQQELYRPEYWCEIMPGKATKANAIMKLKKMLDCDRVVSFGDAINDIPMFEISDQCYAVSNAVEKLKEKATGVIGSNEEDGVALWLEEHYNKLKKSSEE